MKIRLLKSLSIVLALVTVVCVMSSAGLFSVIAREEYPIVYVAGIASSDIYRFNEDGSKDTIFPPSAETIAQAIAGMPKNLLASFASSKSGKEAVGRAFVEGCKEVFADFGCDTNGDVKENTGLDYDNTVPFLKASVRGYYFSFDWRISPFEVAKQLNSYIKNVKELTGSQKVNVVAFSIGGPMFATYLKTYGYDDVSSVVLHSTACLGASCCGLPMSGHVDLRSEYLTQYLDNIMPEFDFRDLVVDLVKILDKSYALYYTVEALESFLMTYEQEIYEEVLVPSLASSSGVWTLCPDECFLDAKEYVFAGREEEYKNLISIIDDYHYNIQANVREILDGIKERGGNLSVISKYNLQIIPIMDVCDFQSDLVIDTRYTSYGATCAKINESLGENYVQQKYPEKNFISPDNVIDASTCWYPENTWFVRDMGHSDIGNDMLDLFAFLFNSDEQPTVFDSEKYPQYLQYDKPARSISPLESAQTPSYKIGSWFKIMFDLVRHLVELVIRLVK
ncbi:MAG: hypothetical protein IJS17_01725 [Clostridia bacterium]|nr:hypothetical protein [Clostridia bacterium]